MNSWCTTQWTLGIFWILSNLNNNTLKTPSLCLSATQRLIVAIVAITKSVSVLPLCQISENASARSLLRSVSCLWLSGIWPTVRWPGQKWRTSTPSLKDKKQARRTRLKNKAARLPLTPWGKNNPQTYCIHTTEKKNCIATVFVISYSGAARPSLVFYTTTITENVMYSSYLTVDDKACTGLLLVWATFHPCCNHVSKGRKCNQVFLSLQWKDDYERFTFQAD